MAGTGTGSDPRSRFGAIGGLSWLPKLPQPVNPKKATLRLQPLICSPRFLGVGMRRCAVAIVILLGVIFANSNAQARGPYGSIDVGNWKGGAYTDDRTGAFSYCAAGTQYTSGIYFVVTIDRGRLDAWIRA